jgi:2-polyprenyl-3-methyl-5-hydroxy-6-metoxy-1,4-benzoquinol methylase
MGAMTKKKPEVEENGVIAGNVTDKYGSKNPLVKRAMQGFNDALFELLALARVGAIHEVGCGEGHLSVKLAQAGYQVKASDFSGKIIATAKKNAAFNQVKIQFKTSSVYDLNPSRDSAPLVMCCEVLEHLQDPDKAMKILRRLASPYLILSVPREPIWRILNMLSGRHVKHWGNTPGHIQHWSKHAFVNMVSEYMEVVKVETPLPWTMVLGKARKRKEKR